MDVIESLKVIKSILEESIIRGGTIGKRNLIRTSGPINILHELVKKDLINNHNCNPTFIKPTLNQSNGEVSIYGFLKKKNQDIVVLPENLNPLSELIEHLDEIDELGISYSEKIISINVRSQLSSVAKNFDTIFERTFAESVNLHTRLNNIVLGEMFLLPIREFDDSYSDINQVKYRDIGSRVESQLRKYIKHFTLINNREDTSTDFHKYERVCLLIVDFSLDVPKLYQTTQELIDDGIVSLNFTGNLELLNYDNFYYDIINKYNQRFNP